MEINNNQDFQNALPEGKFNLWRYILLSEIDLRLVFIITVTLISQSILIFVAYLFEGNMDVLNYPPKTLLWVSMLPFAALFIFLLSGIRLFHGQSIKSFFHKMLTSSGQF